MFESTFPTHPTDPDKKSAAALSAAIGAHLAVVAVLFVVSAITVPRIEEPPQTHVFQVILPPPSIDGPESAPRPPAPKRGVRDAARAAIAPTAPEPPKPSAEPAPDRAQAPPTDLPSDLPGVALPGDPDGRDDGSQKGVRDGTVDGGGGGGDDELAPLDLGPRIDAPVLIKRVEPVYPMAARLARVPGRIVLQAVIGKDGSVESVEVLSSTSPLFDDAARDAVRQWRYRPASMGGRPVRVYFTVVVSFVIR